ncbi:MAG: YesL family protein [Bacillota bacterium]
MNFIYRMLILNLLWLIFSIPIFTVGASTTALYFVIGKVIRGEETREAADFFRSFRSNFRQSTVTWLIISAIMIVIYVNFSLLNGINGISSVFYGLQILVLLQIIIVSIVIFPLISRYELSTFDAFRLAIITGYKSIFIVLLSAVTIFAMAAATIKILPLFVLTYISLTAFCIYGMLNRTIESYNTDAASKVNNVEEHNC